MRALDASKEKEATNSKGFRLVQMQAGGQGSGSDLEEECGGVSFFRNKVGIHLRWFAKELRGLASGSECKLGLHLVLFMGSQASFPISVHLQSK